MAQCSYCQAETDLYDSNVPICIQCSQARETKPKPPPTEQDIRTTLLQELIEATKLSSEALRRYDTAVSQYLSGLWHPNRTQQIENASNNLSIARSELTKAHNRLNDYLGRGIVPEDMERLTVSY